MHHAFSYTSPPWPLFLFCVPSLPNPPSPGHLCCCIAASLLLQQPLLLLPLHSSGAYDQYGYFIPAKFEAIWSTYDRSSRGRLSLLDVVRLVWDKAALLDNPIGT